MRDMPRMNMMLVERQAPSLLDLCVRKAIDNLRYIGDIGETDMHLLERILPHCTVDQLMHIEKSSKGRDLTPVTDKLWKKFFERTFGVDSAKTVIEKMKAHKVNYAWMKLYEAKMKEREERLERSLNKLSKSIQKQNADKKTRQVKTCTLVPPSSKKRSWGGSGPVYNGASKLMKKSIMDLRNSHEMKNLAAIKKISSQRNVGISSVGRQAGSSVRNSASTASSSRLPRPLQRR